MTFLMNGVCDFAGNVPYTYETNNDVLTVAGTKQLFGNCGFNDMSGSFTLETNNGTPVYIS
jgi:hypothetical protein